MIRAGQTLNYEGRHRGVDLGDIRYDKVAKAMGCYGERVTDPQKIKPALESLKIRKASSHRRRS